VVVGLVVAAHGAQKVFGLWGGPGLDRWTQGVTGMGMRPPRFWALASAFGELLGGLALSLGFLVPISAALVTMQIGVALTRVHLPKGFWVTKGGIEFTLVILTVAVLTGVADPGPWSLDRAIGMPALGLLAYLALVIVGLIAYLLGSRPVPQAAQVRKAA
jgi:putative oxidoreductase